MSITKTIKIKTKYINDPTNKTVSKNHYVNIVYPEIEPLSTDKYIITSWEDRLDLLANDYYGDPNLWWIISRANPDVSRRDSFFIPTGVQIRIPARSDISAIIQEFEKLNVVR